jgi:hypothetical protein
MPRYHCFASTVIVVTFWPGVKRPPKALTRYTLGCFDLDGALDFRRMLCRSGTGSAPWDPVALHQCCACDLRATVVWEDQIQGCAWFGLIGWRWSVNTSVLSCISVYELALPVSNGTTAFC